MGNGCRLHGAPEIQGCAYWCAAFITHDMYDQRVHRWVRVSIIQGAYDSTVRRWVRALSIQCPMTQGPLMGQGVSHMVRL